MRPPTSARVIFGASAAARRLETRSRSNVRSRRILILRLTADTGLSYSVVTSARVEVTPSGELRVRARAAIGERASWALYDFANTIFSMNIATLYFAVWIVTERGASATMFSIATSGSSAVVLFAAPYFGARSDLSRRRKPWVVGLTLACVAATALLAPLSAAPLFLLLATFAIAD